jgi:uncharacterized protein YndB with AHSA1/START domain
MSDFGITSTQDSHAVIRFERRYEATAEDVWAALTQAASLSRWLGAEVELRPEVGSQVLLRWPGGEQMTGSILRCHPPRLLEYSWSEGEGEPESVVTFEISPAGSASILVLEHRQLSPGSLAGFSAGWHGHLDALGALLSGEPFDLDGSYERLRPVYEARLADSSLS